ncbi:MAG TPA: hypothetical protein VMS12_13640 [Thermoanaerobaculia bacterium]|nr:hypothetical protein [Thermoanaerobaculia bacterium]
MDPEILVLDGRGVLTRALAQVKTSLNVSLHVASDALQAISLIQLHSYGSLVIDEQVGYVDGWALLRYLEDNEIPLDSIIVSSGDTVRSFDEEFRWARRVQLADLAEVIAERIRISRAALGPQES